MLISVISAIPSGPQRRPEFKSVPADEPFVKALDLGLTRGDGIFESVGVLGGRPLELNAHFRRLEHSALLLDLPPIDMDLLRSAFAEAVALHKPVPELLVKIFVTRGVEGERAPTIWIYAARGPDYTELRSQGLAVVTLDRGYRHDVAQTSPWLLQGVKTLSYALNQAALREAKRRGANDAIFLSTDGFALEGSASSLIIRDATGFHTPTLDFGVLEGTTQARLFRVLESAGYQTSYSRITELDLRQAESVWLVSSGRLVAPVHTLDGAALRVDRKSTSTMLQALFES